MEQFAEGPFLNVWTMPHKILFGTLVVEFALAVYFGFCLNFFQGRIKGLQTTFKHAFLLCLLLGFTFNFPGFHLLIVYPSLTYFYIFGAPIVFCLIFSKIFKGFQCRNLATAIRATIALYLFIIVPAVVIFISQATTHFYINRNNF